MSSLAVTGYWFRTYYGALLVASADRVTSMHA
jgi:hypothetical protein